MSKFCYLKFMNRDKNYDDRFNGISRLIGLKAQGILQRSHVMVIGLGGVGSWAVESLARSGVAKITLVDLDDICISNTNRQIHTTKESIGKSKCGEMLERVLAINPQCDVTALEDFYTVETSDAILNRDLDGVIDAIDSLDQKCHLLVKCLERKISVVTVGGAGGRYNPSKVAIEDLHHSFSDPLLYRVRKQLKSDYGFSRDKKCLYGIGSVFSTERPRYPKEDGEIGLVPTSATDSLGCQRGFGTASFVSGTMGFYATYLIIEKLIEKK